MCSLLAQTGEGLVITFCIAFYFESWVSTILDCLSTTIFCLVFDCNGLKLLRVPMFFVHILLLSVLLTLTGQSRKDSVIYFNLIGTYSQMEKKRNSQSNLANKSPRHRQKSNIVQNPKPEIKVKNGQKHRHGHTLTENKGGTRT